MYLKINLEIFDYFSVAFGSLTSLGQGKLELSQSKTSRI